MSETRKLLAILIADIVGYSRLAGADEDRTLSRLRGLRSDLIDLRHRQTKGTETDMLGLTLPRPHSDSNDRSTSIVLTRKRRQAKDMSQLKYDRWAGKAASDFRFFQECRSGAAQGAQPRRQ